MDNTPVPLRFPLLLSKRLRRRSRDSLEEFYEVRRLAEPEIEGDFLDGFVSEDESAFRLHRKVLIDESFRIDPPDLVAGTRQSARGDVELPHAVGERLPFRLAPQQGLETEDQFGCAVVGGRPDFSGAAEIKIVEAGQNRVQQSGRHRSQSQFFGDVLHPADEFQQLHHRGMVTRFERERRVGIQREPTDLFG